MQNGVKKRFLEKFKRGISGCWIWTARKNTSGLPYGTIKIMNKLEI